MYKSIVVGTDGSATADRAVAHATELALLSGAKLNIATAGGVVVNPVASASGLKATGDVDPNRLNEGLTSVAKAAADAARARGADVETHAIVGDVVDALCELAGDLDADLLVVGNRGMQGIQRFFFDSVPDAVSHKAPCSVLIVDTRDDA